MLKRITVYKVDRDFDGSWGAWEHEYVGQSKLFWRHQIGYWKHRIAPPNVKTTVLIKKSPLDFTNFADALAECVRQNRKEEKELTKRLRSVHQAAVRQEKRQKRIAA